MGIYDEQLQKLVSDEQLQEAFKGTNFGAARDNREIVADTVLKIAGGFGTGYTAICVCQELGLLGPQRKDRSVALTKNGRRYLFWAHAGKKHTDNE